MPGGWSDIRERLHIEIRGAVQGVGFRPFIYRLAGEIGLDGWVANTSRGVTIEVDGSREELRGFLEVIPERRPPLAMIQGLEHRWLPAGGFRGFQIRGSSPGEREALVLPDMATCADCLADIADPDDRRYRYPFTNCTNCGPRYSIITALPYDRPSTTMAGFSMCPDCLDEYRDPGNRRFHAQPNACPVCGPHLELWDPSGTVLEIGDPALKAAVDALLAEEIVAVKGLGGFHLVCLASSERAVSTLRVAKHRSRKPFALMAPSMSHVRGFCRVSPEETELLVSPQAPIVLLRRLESAGIGQVSDLVAPGNLDLGVMLPYTPLHHLLLEGTGAPVVATSGNRSEEPICTDEREALERLSGMAALFLVHDRPITRHVDDSIVRMMDGQRVVLRRARGYAPMPVSVDRDIPSMIGTGAHLKSTVSISVGRNIFTSQHIGDLETPGAVEAFDRVLESITALYGVIPDHVVRDLHPDYVSSRRAEGMGLPTTGVQHHLAHVTSCMLDNSIGPPLLGVSWDGTGSGTDGTIWGGELFHVRRSSVKRTGHLRTFRLPGGDRAVREPRRSALGLLAELFDDAPVRVFPKAFRSGEAETLMGMMASGVNSPVTSSVGRLFDAVASLAGLQQVIEFEGEAAITLEHAAEGFISDRPYTASVVRDAEGLLILDWEPMIMELLEDLEAGAGAGEISSRFHGALVRWIVEAARETGEEKVLLTGGCFQNLLLLEASAAALREAGYKPVVHHDLPPNDGGIAPGQIFSAALMPPLE